MVPVPRAIGRLSRADSEPGRGVRPHVRKGPTVNWPPKGRDRPHPSTGSWRVPAGRRGAGGRDDREAGYTDAERAAARDKEGHYDKGPREIKLASGAFVDPKRFEPPMWWHLLDTSAPTTPRGRPRPDAEPAGSVRNGSDDPISGLPQALIGYMRLSDTAQPPKAVAGALFRPVGDDLLRLLHVIEHPRMLSDK